MQTIRRLGAAATSLLAALAFATSARAAITSSNVTTPTDGALLLYNSVTTPNQTFTVAGTTNGITGNLFDVDCYNGDTESAAYKGPGGTGIPLGANPDSFSVSVPLPPFAGESCRLLVVPHNTTPSPGTSYTGPRVGISSFSVSKLQTGPNAGDAADYAFYDATLTESTDADSLSSCGPYGVLLDGTSAMNVGNELFDCAGQFYSSGGDFGGVAPDLTRAEIEVDGQNAYGSDSASRLPNGSSLANFPKLAVTLDSFDSATGDAQTTESEPIVKCAPSDVYDPSSAQCTSFASTGISIQRVTDYTHVGHVATLTDTISSTDGLAHSVDLLYETDLAANTAGWELPGQTAFYQYATGQTQAAATSAPGTIYAILNTQAAPGFTNPVGSLTYSAPYRSWQEDNTLWPNEYSGLIDYQQMVPASGSVTLTWSYSTGTSLAEVQGYAAATQDAMQPPAIAITQPTAGAVLTSSPDTVTGTASAGSGVKSVTLNGVAVPVPSNGAWSTTVTPPVGGELLTAVLTSNAGNTVQTTVALNYSPPARLTLLRRRFSGRTAFFDVSCSAAGSNCVGYITLSYAEKLRSHHRLRRLTRVLGKTKYLVNFGHTATLQLRLNGTGENLLRKLHKLQVKGVITEGELNGVFDTAASFELTLKRSGKHKHR